MRLIFIPGYGEYGSIFDKIHPHLAGEKVFLDNWALLGDQQRPELTVLRYAREIIARYGITKEDVIIGHSMGGWIAFHIKHLVGCPIIQISSWTDGRKVVRGLKNRHLIYWLVNNGFIYNSLMKRFVVWKEYRNKPSRSVFSSVLDNFIRGSKNNVVNQLRVIFNPVNEKILVSPDLRIHARADIIIRFPDEPTIEVPGDHFSLYIYPEKVYQPILDFLSQEKNKGNELSYPS